MTRLLLALCGLCLVLAACGHGGKPSEIRMGLAQMPLTLDPRYATDAASERVNRLIYRPLVDFDRHSRAVPALAKWEKLSPQHYRFTLGRDGRQFHDGSPLTAHDVAATYRSLLALRDSPHRAEFANIARIDVIDPEQVDFMLRQADEGFVERLIVGIMPVAKIESGHDFSRAPIGSGPLQFVAWSDSLSLQRRSDGQTLSLQEIKDPTVRVLKLLRGEIDLLQGDLPPELVKYLQRQPELRVMHAPGTNFSYLGFNMQDPLVADIRVRQAIAHAIDREAIVRHALVDGSRLAGAVLPPEHWAGNPQLSPYRHDPARARELLQAAGVELPLKLVYKTSTDAQRVRLATMMQAQMQAAGIRLEIRSLDWGTFFDDVKHGKFQLYGLTWVGIKTPEIYRLVFHGDSVPPAGANRGRLNDARLNAMIEAGNWPAVTARVHELLPYVPLWYEGQFAAMRKGLQGYSPAPDGNWDALATIRRRGGEQD